MEAITQLTKKILVPVSVILLCACSSSPHIDKLEPTIAVEFTELDRYWVLVHSEAPKYPIQYRRGNLKACVNMKFVIGEDGRAHDIELLEMWPTTIEPYVESAKSAISKLRFSPAITNATKNIVSTNYVTAFFKPSSVDSPEVEKRGVQVAQKCRLSILAK